MEEVDKDRMMIRIGEWILQDKGP